MPFFHQHIITGPIRSRRLGVSLGVNLLPTTVKICNYDCVYCECGWDTRNTASVQELPTVAQIAHDLEEALLAMKGRGERPDSVTFSGNGEPTIHPEFPTIAKLTVEITSRIYPENTPVVTVISNATMIGNSEVVNALSLCGNVLLKLDAGTPEMYARINRLREGFSLDSYHIDVTPQDFHATLVDNLRRYPHPYTIQTLLFRGEHDGLPIDNTSGKEWQAYLECLRRINPTAIMIYGLDRETPAKKLIKLSQDELETKAEELRKEGFRNVKAFY